mmetsp:Transcript_7947/g.16942  ORF Transcript_7947/g.16942 Transcript_7947/m.16942 type:complete len:85 (+) Transcript_7947:56-310(+)
MPKNKGKGGKNRSRAKSDRNDKRELHYKNTDEGQEYAQVLKMLGGPWLEAYCFDGQKRLCHICGKVSFSSFQWLINCRQYFSKV